MYSKIREFILQQSLLAKYKIFAKYLISGGTGAAVNLISLYILTEFAGVYYLISAVLAFFISLSVGFNLQKHWTFRNKEKKTAKQAALYFTVTASNLLINTFLLYVMVEVFLVWYMLAQVVIYGSLALVNFFIYKYFVFNPSSRRGSSRRGRTPSEATYE